MSEQTLDELRDRVRALAACGGRRILGISGAPGAGKSTVAEALVDPGTSVLVGMDGFHLADHLLVERGIRDRKGAPDTFDVDGFVALLGRLRAQRPGDGASTRPCSIGASRTRSAAPCRSRPRCPS